MRSPFVDVTFPYEPSAGAQTARHQEDNVLSHITEAATDPAAGVAPMTGAAEPLSSEDLLSQILTSLEEDKAEEVVEVPQVQLEEHLVQIVFYGQSHK